MLAEYDIDCICWDCSDDEAPGIQHLCQVEKAFSGPTKSRRGQHKMAWSKKTRSFGEYQHVCIVRLVGLAGSG